jgi:ribosome maturation factor RimP
MKEEIKEKIINTVQSNGCFFVDLKFRRAVRKTFIEVLADTENGITVNECSMLSKKITAVLDEGNFFNDYILDVSSPGIGYALKEKWQFKKNIGRHLEIQYNKGQEKIRISGILKEMNDDALFLENAAKAVIEIKLTEIILAKEKI